MESSSSSSSLRMVNLNAGSFTASRPVTTQPVSLNHTEPETQVLASCDLCQFRLEKDRSSAALFRHKAGRICKDRQNALAYLQQTASDSCPIPSPSECPSSRPIEVQPAKTLHTAPTYTFHVMPAAGPPPSSSQVHPSSSQASSTPQTSNFIAQTSTSTAQTSNPTAQASNSLAQASNATTQRTVTTPRGSFQIHHVPQHIVYVPKTCEFCGYKFAAAATQNSVLRHQQGGKCRSKRNTMAPVRAHFPPIKSYCTLCRLPFLEGNTPYSIRQHQAGARCRERRTYVSQRQASEEEEEEH